MAIKYLCDRCGAEIPNREGITRLRIVRPTKNPDTALYDLCPRCDYYITSYIEKPDPNQN